MAITDAHISTALNAYVERYPEDVAVLADAARLLRHGRDFASRRTFPMHVTVGALLVREEAEILLVEHRAYGLLLQPGGHLEPADTTLVDAAVRELTEETGIDAGAVLPTSRIPVYVEFGQVPARADKGEPSHYHLDFGFAFTTAHAEIGPIQESEVTGAGWYPLQVAERRVGPRIARAVRAPTGTG